MEVKKLIYTVILGALSFGAHAQLTYQTVYKTTERAICGRSLGEIGQYEYLLDYQPDGTFEISVYDYGKNALTKAFSGDSVSFQYGIRIISTSNKHLLVFGRNYTTEIYEIKGKSITLLKVYSLNVGTFEAVFSDSCVAFKNSYRPRNLVDIFEYNFISDKEVLLDSSEWNTELYYLKNKLICLKNGGLFTYKGGNKTKLYDQLVPYLASSFSTISSS